MMKTALAAALLGTAALGGLAYAQSAPQPTPAPATKPLKGDANNDGRVTRAEFIARAEAAFARMDANKDGALTRDEARAGKGPRHGGKRGPGARGGPFEPVAGRDMPPPPPGGATRGPGRGMGPGFARLDTDRDGKVTRAEFAAENGRAFARIDANGDGTVDKAEMAALPGRGRMAARADANGDGALTRAEYDAQAKTRFDKLDTNGDGVLDAAELQGGPGMRRGSRRAPAASPTPPAPTGA
ncbi:EF-hand domain-containing protein [Sphingomonas sp.]|uniref:EF-hand domain-containing protein n=1 Tax=Sphingomonas sp. TaxID=28214 RepID=UPI002DD67AA9|nr:hypothetical protein [Sphingomonas sp.]